MSPVDLPPAVLRTAAVDAAASLPDRYRIGPGPIRGGLDRFVRRALAEPAVARVAVTSPEVLLSRPFPRRRGPASARTAALGVVAVGALVGGLLAPAGQAAAAGSGTGSGAGSADSATGSAASRAGDLTRVDGPVRMRAGRYVTLLRQPSAATYDGSGRFARTRAAAGDPFSPRSTAARTYRSHLERTHDAVARSVGADVVRSFTVASNGFVADLTGRQAAALSTDRRVLLVERDRLLQPDTYNTPDFLGLTGDNGAWTTHGGPRRAGAGTVVGVIDSGIWPESRSFAGAALSSTPQGKWDVYRRQKTTYMDKADGTRFVGTCQTGEDWTVRDCTRKLIGARDYSDLYATNELAQEEYRSPRDGDGHGSHTASTAAGNHDVKASVEGRKFGRISGMAPAAKVAAYKVCYTDRAGDNGCFTSASLAAIDEAGDPGVAGRNY